MKAFYNTSEILLSVKQDELEQLRDACFHAMMHWNELAKNQEDFREVNLNIAMRYAEMHDEIQVIIKELPF